MMSMTDDSARLQHSTLYQDFLAEREEILKHKWIESEKAGRDIGFERALTDWIVKHRSEWRRARNAQRASLYGVSRFDSAAGLGNRPA